MRLSFGEDMLHELGDESKLQMLNHGVSSGEDIL